MSHLGIAAVALCASTELSHLLELLKFCSDLSRGAYIAEGWETFKNELGIMFGCFSCHP